MGKPKKEKVNRHIGLKLTIAFFIFIGGTIAYARYIGTTRLIVKETKLESAKLSDNFHGLKIVQFSDLHYGTTFTEKELEKMVTTINKLKPDLIVFTGDLIDKDMTITETLEQALIATLSKLDANLGKYMISGEEDHEIDSYLSIMEKSGFKNLNNTFDFVYNQSNDYLLIAGLDDSNKATSDINSAVPDKNNINNAKYSILLLHEPDDIKDITIDYQFNLALAGHSHNGQIKLPFVDSSLYSQNGAKRYSNPHYKIENTDLYISSGLGTSILPFRYFTPPSINFFRLTKTHEEEKPKEEQTTNNQNDNIEKPKETNQTQ